MYSHNNFHEDVHVISVLNCVPGASSCIINNVLCKTWCWRNEQLYFDLSPGDDPGPPDLVDLRPGLNPGLLGEDGHVHTKLRKEAGGQFNRHLEFTKKQVWGHLGQYKFRHESKL